MPLRIEEYALIGDCETAALVGRDGSIDWLCWPRFDSAACFAALLGSHENGRWLLAPSAPASVRRRYRDGTLVLETEFETAEGGVTLVDFMPVHGTLSDLVRIAVGRHGRVHMRMELVLRFDYGSCVPWVTRCESGAVRAISGPDMTVLHSSVPVHGEGLKTVANFTLAAGETTSFVLTYSPSHLPQPAPVDVAEALAETEEFWRQWSSRCQYDGEWPDAVRRSLITLKAMTYAPTGGLVAAATTSLPEKIGGSRNWDYRFCWVRDATLTLLALMDAGYVDEARAWRDWLLRASGGNPTRLQIMYGLGGERRLPEFTVPWLPGYEGSTPVRVGNAAAEQVQLDVYGELADALHQARHGGLVQGGADWSLQKRLIEHLATIWDQPDEGIWEVRGGRQHFTHSKVMAWVALDRTLRSADEFGLKGPLDRWRALRDRIHRDACERGYDPKLGAFVQTYGSETLDASLLTLPLVGFLPASDPRVQSTLRAIERGLVVDGFVMRYDTRFTRDGLPEGEGAFLACSFWYVDNLALQGRVDEARELFERLLALCNDVGLLAEEYDPVAKRQLGNFPQAFSHLALVGAALNLSRGAKPTEQRASGAGAPPGATT
jgi:GH15 family glucan-1,4-alpha-glucosidase